MAIDATILMRTLLDDYRLGGQAERKETAIVRRISSQTLRHPRTILRVVGYRKGLIYHAGTRGIAPTEYYLAFSEVPCIGYQILVLVFGLPSLE